jgi:hypothetical protein
MSFARFGGQAKAEGLPCVLSSLFILLGACYTSTAGTSELRGDGGVDAMQDPAADVAGDMETGEEVEHVIEFLVTNLNPREGDSFYLSTRGYWRDPIQYPYTLTRYADGWWQPVVTYKPWCAVNCALVEPGSDCCIMCEPPNLNPIVKRLEGGESLFILWDGTTYEWDEELCECGCYRVREAAPGPYRFELCAYSDYDCLWQSCIIDENGVIEAANVSGFNFCPEREFDLPEAYGSVIDSYLGGWD